MPIQRRNTKVFAILLMAMTAGTIVLIALGSNPPSAGAFCLSRYYHLDPVEKAITSRAVQLPSRWDSIEVYYSGAKDEIIEQSAPPDERDNLEDVNCHFYLYNGSDGSDGQIQPTEKWQRQWSTIPGRNWYGNGSGQTIRICIMADGKTACPTDFQVKRAEVLVDMLSRKFNIRPEYIYYPSNWQ
jgi:hypothetical protein